MSHRAISIADRASVNSPPGPAPLAACRSLAAMASTCSGFSPMTRAPRASTASRSATVSGPPKNVRPMPSTPASVPISSVTNSRVALPTGIPTTRGLSAGVLMIRVLTCVTFMLHSLCVCCLSVRLDSHVSRVRYMIDPDASRNQRAGEFLTNILEVHGISADMFPRVENQSQFLEDKNMLFRKKEHGFSIVELMVSMSIIGLVSALSVPSLKSWSRNYNVQSAALDLYAHMHIAKLGAVKENRAWTIHFNPEGLSGYQVQNSAGKTVKTIDFRAKYSGEIQYADPTTTKTFDAPTIADRKSVV